MKTVSKCPDCVKWIEVQRVEELRGGTSARLVMHRLSSNKRCRGSNVRVEQPAQNPVHDVVAAELAR